MIKLIIAGGRDFNDYPTLQLETQRFLVEQNFNPSQLIIVSGKQKSTDEQGNCFGADYLGEQFAKKYNFPIQEFPADWNSLDVVPCFIRVRKNGDKYNAAAGHIRNEEMAKFATHAIIFWDSISHGSKNMIENARKYELTYKIINY